MQIQTGKIEYLDESQLEKIARMDMSTHIPIPDSEVGSVKAMDKPKRKNWMRNKPCPCDSGKKFKACCWNKYSNMRYSK